MSHANPGKRKKTPKRVLALPDLEHAKSAVLSSLTSRSGQRTYGPPGYARARRILRSLGGLQLQTHTTRPC